MVAYDFPPMNTSGSARPQFFAKYLSDYGYWPIVLTRDGLGAESGIADHVSLSTVDGLCQVERVRPGDNDHWDSWFRRWFGFLDFFSFCSREKKSIAEFLTWRLGLRYKEYVHWVLPGVLRGLSLVRKNKINIIWATGPRWGSLRIGYWLSRLSRLPLIVDIRDPWTYGVLWDTEKKIACQREATWEEKILNYASRVIYTSPLTADIARNKYPALAEKISCITNGFSNLSVPSIRNCQKDKCLFVYLGRLDEGFRNPASFFKALNELKYEKEVYGNILVQIYSSSSWAEKLIKDCDLCDVVEYRGFVPQDESLQIMRGADCLLLLQTIKAEGSDVISGKVYEYLATGNQILGIVPENGGDAWILKETSHDCISFDADPADIAEMIRACYRRWKLGTDSNVQAEDLERFSRQTTTQELANVFDELLAS